MTQKQLAALALRILAIYTIINSLGVLQNGLSTVASFALSGGFQTATVPLWRYALTFLPFTLFAACGVLIWILADAIAYFMCSGEDRELRVVRFPAVEILTLAFSVTGVWFALSALLPISQLAIWLLAANISRGPGGNMMYGLIISTVQIAIGLALFFNARKIADKVAARYQFSPPTKEELS